MIIKNGDIITLASGIFESYDREGPFVAVQDFDLEAFVSYRACAAMGKLEVADLLGAIPGMLIELGLLAKLPCRKIHLGSMGRIDVKAEKDEL